MTKYQIGDIISNGFYHYLVEDVRANNFSDLCYHLRRLQNNQTITSFVLVTDNDIDMEKVA